MDVVILFLGLFGFGSMIIAVYVFTVSSRAANSTEKSGWAGADKRDPGVAVRRDRRIRDRRRSSQPTSFPFELNGVLIAKDRRSLHDQRAIIH